MREPVLVLGMHRSGTSLIARALTRLGVFMGGHLDPNHEAYAFQELNRFVLREAGARWDEPEPLMDMLQDPEVRGLVRAHLERMVHSPYMRIFIGTRLRRRSPLERLGLWGWKDPRTVLLLPVWLEVFPGARLVHVRRHGVDVAASLRARHRRTLAGSRERLARGELFSWKTPFRPFVDTIRAGTLEGAFGLWEHYLAVAERHLAERDALELGYEGFLADVPGGVRRLADHVGAEATQEMIAEVAADADRSRAFAFRREPELLTFAGRVADRLRRYGYDVNGEAEG